MPSTFPGFPCEWYRPPPPFPRVELTLIKIILTWQLAEIIGFGVLSAILVSYVSLECCFWLRYAGSIMLLFQIPWILVLFEWNKLLQKSKGAGKGEHKRKRVSGEVQKSYRPCERDMCENSIVARVNIRHSIIVVATSVYMYIIVRIYVPYIRKERIYHWSLQVDYPCSFR